MATTTAFKASKAFFLSFFLSSQFPERTVGLVGNRKFIITLITEGSEYAVAHSKTAMCSRDNPE